MASPEGSKQASTPFGVFLIFIGAVFWAFNSIGNYVTVKVFSDWMVGFATALVYIPSVAFIRWDFDQKYQRMDNALIFCTGFLDVLGLICRIAGFSMLSVGDASAIIYSKPVICSVMTKLFLEDKVGLTDCVIVVANLIGVVLVSKPGFIFGSDPSEDQERQYFGALACVLSATIGSVHLITIRKLKEREAMDPALLMSVKSVVGLGVLGLMLSASLGTEEVKKSLIDWSMLGVTAFCALMGCFFVYVALQTESPAVVASIGTTEVIVAYLFQVAFTSDELDWIALLGAGLIVLSPVWYLLASVIEQIEIERRGL